MSLPIKSIEYFTEKYGMYLIGGRRIYSIPLNERKYGYERCIPFYLKLNDFVNNDNRFARVIPELFKYLQAKYPKPIEDFIKFRTPWSRAAVFGDHKFMANCVQVLDNLYMSINFTGLHATWFIQDLINFFNPKIEDYLFYVRVPCMNEPIEVKNDFGILVVESFKIHLKEQGKTDKSIEIILKNIGKLNKFLQTLNIGWNDFYLIDELKNYQVIKARVFDYIRKHQILNEDHLEIANKSLNYLYNFMKTFN